MENTVNVEQKAAVASNATQIAVQNNYTGLSPTEVVHTAFSLFQQYYPMLRKELIDELKNDLFKELDGVTPEKIDVPNPRLAIPALQNASITTEKEIRDMYTQLLAKSMNRDYKDRVHPAFNSIINEMSSFDAALLFEINKINNSIPLARVTFVFGDKYLLHALPRYFSPYLDSLGDNWRVSASIENLVRLNLIHMFEGTVNGYNYESILSHPFIKNKYDLSVLQNSDLSIKKVLHGKLRD